MKGYIINHDLFNPIVTIYEDNKDMQVVGTVRLDLSPLEARTPQNGVHYYPDLKNAIEGLILLHKANLKAGDNTPEAIRRRLINEALSTYAHALRTRANYNPSIKREFLKRMELASNDEIKEIINRLNVAIQNNEKR